MGSRDGKTSDITLAQFREVQKYIKSLVTCLKGIENSVDHHLRPDDFEKELCQGGQKAKDYTKFFVVSQIHWLDMRVKETKELLETLGIYSDMNDAEYEKLRERVL